MLVNTKAVLNKAREEKYAIPQFNINNLEWTRFILEACEEKRSPVILGASESAISYMGGYHTVVNLVESLIMDLQITVPVILHLDHGKSLESCNRALEAGFSSVMIDASSYPLEKNIQITNEVVECAKKYGATVEGEIGTISNHNDVVEHTNAEETIAYTMHTHLDSLAPAVGSVHGMSEKGKLDFGMISTIAEKTRMPLVLHGGSGIDSDQIKRAVDKGICKINFNTELQMAWANSVREFLKNTQEYDPRKIIKSGENALKNVVHEKIELLGSSNKV